MARQPRQIARGTTAEVAAYTGPNGEPVFNVDTKRIHVQDGATPGGHPAATLAEHTALDGRVGAAEGAITVLQGDVASLALDDLTDVDLTTAPPAPGDGFVYDGVNFVPGPAGGGMFKGDNGTVGSRSGDIFRINNKSLTANTTIAATENASCAGPLTVATDVTLTVAAGGSLVIL